MDATSTAYLAEIVSNTSFTLSIASNTASATARLDALAADVQALVIMGIIILVFTVLDFIRRTIHPRRSV